MDMRNKGKWIALLAVGFVFATAVLWAQEQRGPMKPIGPLMIEHRQIERMVALMVLEVNRIKEGKPADPVFTATAVDFFRVYGDKTHHGKEEEIFFRLLAKKNLSPEHKQVMANLIAEHEQARVQVGRLVAAKDRLDKDNAAATKEIQAALQELSTLYPRHIVQEDRAFFMPALDYLSAEEQAEMVRQMIWYDRNMIHAKYRDIINETRERMQK
jgi:hemerythrin-like domain-containing protein